MVSVALIVDCVGLGCCFALFGFGAAYFVLCCFLASVLFVVWAVLLVVCLRGLLLVLLFV